MNKTLHTWAGLLACALLGAGNCSQAAPSEVVIAMVAALGDRLTVVRQKPSTGSHLEPFDRQSVPLSGQALNLTLLRGLSRALAEQEPDAKRVALLWEPDDALLKRLGEIQGRERDEQVLEALRTHLRQLPERAGWTRIEALVPRHVSFERKGMASRLSGVGVYVQPLASDTLHWGPTGLAEPVLDESSSTRTVDPQTGTIGQAYTYVAPYIYFERVTLDASSLELLARRPQFDNIKYHDPNAQAQDVARHLSGQQMVLGLLDLAERAAYQSVRGKQNSVQVSEPVPVATPAQPASPPRQP